jgi:hypothetical protein
MRDPLLRETLNTIEAAGFVPAVSNGSRHLLVYWIDDTGCQHHIALSRGRAPRGPRHEHNLRAQLRRKLNGAMR